MSVYNYIGNKTRKEYLKCPFKCSLKYPYNFNLDNCIPRLMAFKLSDKSTGWSNDKLEWYDDNYLPWDSCDNEEGFSYWRDITYRTLFEYNQLFHELSLDEGCTNKELLHSEEMKTLCLSKHNK